MTECGYKVAQRDFNMSKRGTCTFNSVVATWHNKSWNAENTCHMLTCTLYLVEISTCNQIGCKCWTFLTPFHTCSLNLSHKRVAGRGHNVGKLGRKWS